MHPYLALVHTLMKCICHIPEAFNEIFHALMQYSHACLDYKAKSVWARLIPYLTILPHNQTLCITRIPIITLSRGHHTSSDTQQDGSLPVKTGLRPAPSGTTSSNDTQDDDIQYQTIHNKMVFRKEHQVRHRAATRHPEYWHSILSPGIR